MQERKTLKSGFEFRSLQHKKQILEDRIPDVRTAVRSYLLSQVLAFELGKNNQKSVGPDCQKLCPERLETALGYLLMIDKKIDELEREDLYTVHQLLTGGGNKALLDQPLPPMSPSHQPLDPLILPVALHRFFHWTSSPSFAEMHAVEQMTVSQIRLHEISPFRYLSGTTVSIFSYYFLLAAGYLVPLYKLNELPEFYEALTKAFAFSTQDLVSFNLGACERAYDFVLGKP